MQKCNYCGFVTKYNLDKCPSCGATQYTKIDNFSQYEVENASNINLKNIIKPIEYKNTRICIYVSICLIVFFIFLLLRSFNYIKTGISKDNFINLFICLSYIWCILIPFISFKKKAKFEVLILLHVIVFFLVFKKAIDIYDDKVFVHFLHIPTLLLSSLSSFYCLTELPSIIKSISDKKRYNSLKQNGVLIKNLKYTIKEDRKNPKFKRIVVKYINKDNVEFELESKQSFYKIPKDSTVDLLIDTTNFNNYFIDFEIN